MDSNDSEDNGTGADDFDETWIVHLQEMLESLEPQIRQTNALKILEDVLTSLESTDPNFHRYNLIRQIRKKLELDLAPLIDDLIKHNEVVSGGNMLASDVSNKLIQSEEFVKTSSSILDYIRLAADNLTDHLNSDTFDFTEHSFRHDDKTRHGYESMCSTNDGIDLMFMSPNHYKTLAKDLDPVNSLDTRLKSLTALQQVPQTDLLASDAWDVTRRGLLCALDDENEEVHLQALTFLSNLFVSGSSHVVKEYFMILIENMIDYFNETTSHMVCIDSGLDLGDRRNVYLVRKFRLLHEIQVELPANWLRYSDKYIEEIIHYVFQLLHNIPTPISNTIGSKLLSPLHFLSLLDPIANWFKLWMHGLYGRSEIFKSLKKYPDFLIEPIEVCLNLPYKLRNKEMSHFYNGDNDTNSNDDDFIYTRAGISYTYFLHSLSMIGRLMLYKDSYKLLNVSLSDGRVVTRKTLLITLIEILKTFPIGSLNSSKSLYHPVFLIVDILSSFAHNGEETCKDYFCNDEVFDTLVTSFRKIIDSNKISAEINFSTLNVIADILADISTTECGKEQFISNSTSVNTVSTSSTSAAPIHVITKTLCTLLEQSSHDNLTINTMCSLMSLCCNIYMTCDGINVMKQYKLHKKIFTCLTAYKTKLRQISEKFSGAVNNSAEFENDLSLVTFRKLPNHDQVIYKCYFNLVKEMLDNLINYCMTPRGVELVKETGGLYDCVTFLFDKYQSYEQCVSKIDKYGYEVIMSQLSVIAPGVGALYKAGYLTNLVERAWSHLEGYSNDYTRIILSDIPEDLSHRTTKKLFLSMVKLLSNFDAVYEIIGKSTTAIDNNETRTETSEKTAIEPNYGQKSKKMISDFHGFFTGMILIDSYEKQQALLHVEQTHFFALNVLSCIITCLDTLLFLETKFHFKESLLSLQAMCKAADSNAFIIDQCSVKRNQILVMANLIGGVNERYVPPDTLTMDSSSPYPWPLFSSLPLPDVYTIKSMTLTPVSTSGKKSSLETYLADIQMTDFSKSDKQRAAIEAIRVMYFEEVKAKMLKSSDKIIQKLLISVVDILSCDTKVKSNVPEEKAGRGNKMVKLSECDELAIDMMARYGENVKSDLSVEEIGDILKALCVQWKNYNYDSQNHVISYKGTDWFVLVIGLMFSDQKGLAFDFLKKFHSLARFRCFWFARHTNSKEKNKIHPVFSKICYYVEYLLQKELPQVSAAFRLTGYSPSQICFIWFRQYFLNYMNWGDITWYVTSSVVMGIDYQIYFALAIFRHFADDILRHTQENELVIFLRMTSFKDFHFPHYVEYMKDLELKYRMLVIDDLLNN